MNLTTPTTHTTPTTPSTPMTMTTPMTPTTLMTGDFGLKILLILKVQYKLQRANRSILAYLYSRIRSQLWRCHKRRLPKKETSKWGVDMTYLQVLSLECSNRFYS